MGEAVEEIQAAGTKIDILVNNAGISGPFLLLDEFPLDEWRRVVDVNLTGAFVCSKAVVPAMRAGGYLCVQD